MIFWQHVETSTVSQTAQAPSAVSDWVLGLIIASGLILSPFTKGASAVAAVSAAAALVVVNPSDTMQRLTTDECFH